MTDADIRFYSDPVCPFAWMTSKWVRMWLCSGTTPSTGGRAFAESLLARAGLPAGLADALDDTRWDEEIRAEEDAALR